MYHLAAVQACVDVAVCACGCDCLHVVAACMHVRTGRALVYSDSSRSCSADCTRFVCVCMYAGVYVYMSHVYAMCMHICADIGTSAFIHTQGHAREAMCKHSLVARSAQTCRYTCFVCEHYHENMYIDT